MRRRVPVLVAAMLLFVACSDAVTVETTVRPTATTSVAPTSTTSQPASPTTSPPAVSPTADTDDYYRFGTDGLSLVSDGTETHLVSQPVSDADDDLMGGVIYRLPTDSEASHWLHADGTTSELTGLPTFVAMVDGMPTAAQPVPSTADPIDLGLRLVTLGTDDARVLPAVGFEGDGRSFPASAGGVFFVGVEGAAFGCGGSDADIVFWDIEGGRVEHPHNPVAEPCGPCELSAMISPDGATLAYTFRADAASEYHERLVCGEEDDWWSETQAFAAQVVVVDLATGVKTFQATAEPQVRITDFDGRRLVIEQYRWDRPDQPVTSWIYDTGWAGDPVSVAGRVALMHEPVLVLSAKGLGVTWLGEPAAASLQKLDTALGTPTETIVVDPTAEDYVLTYGYAAVDYFRIVRWDGVGLSAVFSDADYYRSDGVPHLVYWMADGPELATDAGIRVGATVEDLVSAFGDALRLPTRFEPECDNGWLFWVEPDGVSGRLDGAPSSPTTRVKILQGGTESSC